MKKLLLARHGDLGPEYDGRYIGSTDIALADQGRDRLHLLTGIIALYAPAGIICSPLRRARQTAEWIAEELGLPVEIDNDLQEVDFGSWEGRSFPEIAKNYPEEVEQWATLAPDFRFPEGEDLGAFTKRVLRAANRLSGLSRQSVLAVTHGGVIRMMICHLLGLSLKNYLLFNVKPARLAIIDIFDNCKGVLTGLNIPHEV